MTTPNETPDPLATWHGAALARHGGESTYPNVPATYPESITPVAPSETPARAATDRETAASIGRMLADYERAGDALIAAGVTDYDTLTDGVAVLVRQRHATGTSYCARCGYDGVARGPGEDVPESVYEDAPAPLPYDVAPEALPAYRLGVAHGRAQGDAETEAGRATLRELQAEVAGLRTDADYLRCERDAARADASGNRQLWMAFGDENARLKADAARLAGAIVGIHGIATTQTQGYRDQPAAQRVAAVTARTLDLAHAALGAPRPAGETEGAD